MKPPITGGCLCGAVRYEVSTEPLMRVICYCRDCQRASGAPHFAAFLVPVEALRVTGERKQFAVIGDSGKQVHRTFCPDCGTTLFGQSETMLQGISISAASLDDPKAFAPQVQFYTASAQPWDIIDPQLPQFTRMPDA